MGGHVKIEGQFCRFHRDRSEISDYYPNKENSVSKTLNSGIPEK